MSIDINETKERLSNLYDSLIKYKIKIAYTTQSKIVVDRLMTHSEYKSTEPRNLSYKYINFLFGFNPIFLFKFDPTMSKTTFISEMIYRCPVGLDTMELILDYSKLDIKFEGEYYEWCDFRLLIHDVFNYVPQDDDLVKYWDIVSNNDMSISYHGLDRSHCELFKDKDHIVTRLNMTPYNLLIPQIITDRIDISSILEII